MLDIVRIPEGRTAVLIGPEGRTRRFIEEQTRTKLRIADGVEIEGESLDCYVAGQIVRAIGRGFAPERALLLLEEDVQLFVITLREHSERKRRTLISRLAGRNGRARALIERHTGAALAIAGKTVAIIGTHRQVEEAADAVYSILAGRSHGAVYHRLERASKRRDPLSGQ